MSALLEARGISKAFGSVVALDGVDLAVGAGEVLGLVGDNGAGKSTLLKVVCGVHAPDAGQLAIQGSAAEFGSPAEARRRGVAAVFQELELVDCLDITSNVFLGAMPRRGIIVDRRQADARTAQALAALNFTDRSTRSLVSSLTGGQRQVVAIARALVLDASVIVMDEPTAALGVSDREQVALTIAALRAAGKAIVLVSHDLDFVLDLADRIQVLRHGRTSAVRERGETDRDDIIALITGAA